MLGAKGLWKRLSRDKSALVGFVIVVLFAAVTLLAPSIAPHDPYKSDLRETLKPPVWHPDGSSRFLLGSDMVGRDIASNIIYGTRVSFTIGIGATVISVLFGVAIGVLSGFYGGKVDTLFMRLVDIQLAVPAVLIALAVMTVLGRGILLMTLVIGFTTWPAYARTSRGSTLTVMNTEYVESARALGASDLTIVMKHVLPNIMTPVIILIAVQLPRVIMLESTLSFLGVGVPITTPSLGLMISRGFRVLFSGAWWITVFPGLVLMLSVLGINLIGDWLRDVFDPRFQQVEGRA